MTLADPGDSGGDARWSAAPVAPAAENSSALDRANEFLRNETAWEPDQVLDCYDELSRGEPVIATRLARELATRFLRRQQTMTEQTVDRLWKACKQVEAFGFARRILGRRLDGGDAIQKMTREEYPEPPTALKLR